ncbi:MAG: gliding motility-associated C-terminal domain-containing protein [Bacteroidota bacterium]
MSTLNGPASSAVPFQLSASTSSFGAWQISCAGASDGSIDLQITGAVLPVSISWSDGDTNEDRSGLTAGQYTATVTDGIGQVDSISITLNEPPALSVVEDSIRDASCPLVKTGFILISVYGGVAPYTYAWSDGSVAEDNDSLRQGVYTVTVSDANGCSVSGQFVVGSYPPVAVQDSITPVSCFGLADGAIDISVSGGLAPFRYLWSTGSTVQDISGLISGSYSVIVRYGGGCRDTVDFFVPEPASIQANATVDDMSCTGASDGSVVLSPTGGNPPYGYAWSNGSVLSSLNGLSAGTYTVTVVDQKNCTLVDSFTVEEPLPLVASAGSDRITCKDTLQLNAGLPSGATGTWSAPLNASVSFSDSMLPDAQVYGYGTGVLLLVWTVSVPPCEASDTLYLIKRSEEDCNPQLNLPNAITPNNDGFNDTFFVGDDDDFPGLELTVYDRVGHLLFRARPYRNDWFGQDDSGTPLPAGTYYVRVKTNDGSVYNTFVDLSR